MLHYISVIGYGATSRSTKAAPNMGPVCESIQCHRLLTRCTVSGDLKSVPPWSLRPQGVCNPSLYRRTWYSGWGAAMSASPSAEPSLCFHAFLGPAASVAPTLSVRQLTQRLVQFEVSLEILSQPGYK